MATVDELIAKGACFQENRPSENGDGIISVGSSGLRKFQIGDDGTVFTIDVIRTLNLWVDVERPFRNEKGVVPPEKNTARNDEMVKFVCDIVEAHGGTKPMIDYSRAFEFMSLVTKEVNKLRRFFDPRSPSEPT